MSSHGSEFMCVDESDIVLTLSAVMPEIFTWNEKERHGISSEQEDIVTVKLNIIVGVRETTPIFLLYLLFCKESTLVKSKWEKERTEWKATFTRAITLCVIEERKRDKRLKCVYTITIYLRFLFWCCFFFIFGRFMRFHVFMLFDLHCNILFVGGASCTQTESWFVFQNMSRNARLYTQKFPYLFTAQWTYMAIN